jgi:hypothetical protein
VVSGQGLEDPRDIVTIGFYDLEPAAVEGFLKRVATTPSRR